MNKIITKPFLLGFKDNISPGKHFKMPDLDVFSLLDIRRRKRRSRGKRKNGNLKRKHKNKTFWTLTDLWKILKSGRHQMLSKLSSLSMKELINSMIVNITSIIQLFLIDVTLNMLFDHTLIRKLIILGTLSKYHSSIRVSISSIYLAYLEIILLNHLFSDYFENKEPPIICYKYNKPIRSTIFNFNKLVANLDIDTKTPDS